MRIIGGVFGGRRLFVPRGLRIRPTADQVKEAVFNILGPLVEGARVLDLFAGVGALGLEAMSRGAAEAVLVDREPAALEAIRRNVATLGLAGIMVHRIDLTRGPGRLKKEEPFNLIFLDPPYGRNLAPRALNLIARLGLAAPEAWAVVEHGPGDELAPVEAAWRLIQRRTYGQTMVTFFQMKN
ncbi:MAG: 16S rRNA (guanine(966)-N(2))-methyltransferase RsmD [Thermodesulfobacteriota bacterium]